MRVKFGFLDFFGWSLATLGACTHGPAHEAPRAALAPDTGQVVRAPGPAFLKIAAMTILGRELQAPGGSCCTRCDGAAEPWLSVYENGLLTARGNPLGQLRSDGRFVDLDGMDRMLVHPDGRVSVAPETKNPFRDVEIVVAEDGTTTFRPTAVGDELDPVTSLTHLDECRVLGYATSKGGAQLDRCLCTYSDAVPSDLKRTAAFARVVFDVIRWLSLSGCHPGSTGICADYPGDAPASSDIGDDP